MSGLAIILIGAQLVALFIAWAIGALYGFKDGWDKGYAFGNTYHEKCEALHKQLELMSKELKARLAIVHPDEWGTEEGDE